MAGEGTPLDFLVLFNTMLGLYNQQLNITAAEDFKRLEDKVDYLTELLEEREA